MSQTAIIFLMMHKNISNNLEIALNKLNNLDFDFLIIGGLICNAVLANHARRTSDIDLICNTDFHKLEELFKKEFDVVRFLYFPLTNEATEESFSCFVRIDNEVIHIEGRRFDIFNKFKRSIYRIGQCAFSGVSVELQIAEKIIAMFSIEVPLYKHLVDLYSFSKLNDNSFNKNDIKNYLKMLLSYKNNVKKKLKLPLIDLQSHIEVNKKFEGSLLLPLQAQYNHNKEYIISEINKWLPQFFD